MARPKNNEPTRKEQLTEWFDAQIDPMSWVTMTYQQIADAISTEENPSSPSTVRNLLPEIVAHKQNRLPSEVLEQKATYRKEVQKQMTPDKIRLLKEWRGQVPSIPLPDCAFRLEVSLQAVRDCCKLYSIP